MFLVLKEALQRCIENGKLILYEPSIILVIIEFVTPSRKFVFDF